MVVVKSTPVSYTHLDVYKRQVTEDIHASIWMLAAYTVLLCFTLFKTGSMSKSIFNAH